MLQRFTQAKSATVTAGDTALHAFGAIPGAVLYIWCPSTNSGDMIVGAADGGGTGIRIPKGTASPFAFGPMLMPEALAYKMAGNSDSFDYLMLY